MSLEYTTRRYKFRRIDTRRLEEAIDNIQILDDKFKIDLKTAQLQGRGTLDLRFRPVFSIPLRYNSARKVFEVVEGGQAVDALLKARYFGTTLPSETQSDDYYLAMDENHRLYVVDDQAIAKIDRLLNSIGDAGENPLNYQGKSLLYLVKGVYSAIGWETTNIVQTTSPLSANEEYNSGWIDLTSFRVNKLGIVVNTDQDGTLYLEQSGDGNEVDYSDSWDVAGGTLLGVKAELIARYFRIRYVNGNTDQTKFRLFAKLFL